MPRSPSNPPPHKSGAIYFLVGNRPSGPWSYTWRVGWGRTSFYIKSTYPPFADIKVSLHGNDSRHGRPFFKLGLDQSAVGRLPEDQAYRRETGLPLVFPGIEVSSDVVHAVRIRTTWDLFQRPDQSARPPDRLRARDYGGQIPAPELGRAVDVDLFVGQGKPYWPEEQDLTTNNAGMGPLRSEADDFLTAGVFHRATAQDPTPANALERERSAKPILRRGFGCAVDEKTGLLWIVEQMLDVGTGIDEA